MKGFKELVAEKVKMKDGRNGYFFASSSGHAPAKIKVLIKDRSKSVTKKVVKGNRVNSNVVGLKAVSIAPSLKKHSGMVKESNKSKIKSHTQEFLILSERLKEATKLKATGKYRDRDFDKLVDAL